MSKVMPRLTIVGFATTLPERASAAMMDFYEAKYSQTNTFRGKIKPLAWLVHRYGDKPNEASKRIGDELRTYLRGIFDDATVEVSHEEKDSRLNLTANIIIRDNGVDYSLGHVIRISQSKIINIIDMVNDGIIYEPLKDI